MCDKDPRGRCLVFLGEDEVSEGKLWLSNSDQLWQRHVCWTGVLDRGDEVDFQGQRKGGVGMTQEPLACQNFIKPVHIKSLLEAAIHAACTKFRSWP